MKYQDEYRDPTAAQQLCEAIHRSATRPWTIMEVCGGQTHSIVRYGIDELLPSGIELVHGPGCPVCVTPLELIDKAIHLASRPDVIFCSFGDMLRVPGSRRDLFAVKAAGGDVRIVYSPLDCLRIAEQNPERTVVFVAADTGHRYVDSVFARHREAADVDSLAPHRAADPSQLALPWSRMEWGRAPAPEAARWPGDAAEVPGAAPVA